MTAKKKKKNMCFSIFHQAERGFMFLVLLVLLSTFYSCDTFFHSQQEVPTLSSPNYPPLFPSYTSGIVIPKNIAPLNFSLPDSVEKTFIKIWLSSASTALDFSSPLLDTLTFSFGRKVHFKEKFWKKLLEKALGKKFDSTISIQVYTFSKGIWTQYCPIRWRVAPEPIDPYLVYRLVLPGDGVYNVLGIYQRNLSNFKVRTLMQNTLTDGNCMNCHTYSGNNSEVMVLHLRYPSEGSLLVNGKKIEKIVLPPQAKEKSIRLIYPAYHPNGKYIAFSTNLLMGISGFDVHRKMFNSIDSLSRIVIYDVSTHSLFTTPALFDSNYDFTYPTWAPDGKMLYFSRAKKERIDTIYPNKKVRIQQIRFDLAAIAFNPLTRCFSDTIQTIISASKLQKSVTLPRISADGKSMLVCISSFSSFPARTDGDLLLLRLSSYDSKIGQVQWKTTIGAEILNSTEAESFHSWSKNGHWVVFSTKRIDGYFSYPCIAYFDGNQFSKPFLLPQKDGDKYRYCLKAFNLPEFTYNSSPLTPANTTEAKYSQAKEIKIEF
ncbi:MAG: hypothetical protein RR084_07130 [Bacteroidales bacterium]